MPPKATAAKKNASKAAGSKNQSRSKASNAPKSSSSKAATAAKSSRSRSAAASQAKSSSSKSAAKPQPKYSSPKAAGAAARAKAEAAAGPVAAGVARLRHTLAAGRAGREVNLHPLTIVISSDKEEAAGLFDTEITREKLQLARQADESARLSSTSSKRIRAPYFQAQVFGTPGKRGEEKEANRRVISAEYEKRGTSFGCMVGKGCETYVFSSAGKQYVPVGARAVTVCAVNKEPLTPTRIMEQLKLFWDQKMEAKIVKLNGHEIRTVKRIDGVVYEDVFPVNFSDKLPTPSGEPGTGRSPGPRADEDGSGSEDLW